MTTEAAIERAFRAGVRQVTDEVQIGLLRDALDRRDVAGALEVIDLDPAAFDQLRTRLVETYAQSGAESTASMRGVRWNSANPRAEEYARSGVGTRITYITQDSLAAVRNTIADGYAFGRTPRRIALDIVGRVGANGVRQGGVVGLSQQQAGWIDNMRRTLADNPEAALRYGLRDRRFDRLLRSGARLTQDQTDNIIRGYSNKLLLSRGKTIARTERGLAINEGRMEGYRQAADKYGVPHSTIKKTWVYTGRSTKERPEHRAANKEVVYGIDTPFSTGLRYPHDPFGLPGQTINCMCEIKLSL